MDANEIWQNLQRYVRRLKRTAVSDDSVSEEEGSADPADSTRSGHSGSVYARRHNNQVGQTRNGNRTIPRPKPLDDRHGPTSHATAPIPTVLSTPTATAAVRRSIGGRSVDRTGRSNAECLAIGDRADEPLRLVVTEPSSQLDGPRAEHAVRKSGVDHARIAKPVDGGHPLWLVKPRVVRNQPVSVPPARSAGFQRDIRSLAARPRSGLAGMRHRRLYL